LRRADQGLRAVSLKNIFTELLFDPFGVLSKTASKHQPRAVLSPCLNRALKLPA